MQTTNNKMTSVFILGAIGVIFIIDAIFIFLGHTSISECFTNGIHKSTFVALLFGAGVGGLVAHFWGSVDYNK